MAELHKAVYREQRSIMRYDDDRAILYPNETVIENYQPEKQEGAETAPPAITGYQYEGEEADGGYIRDCADITDLHAVANAIMRTKYELSEELALQRHYQTSPEEYAEQWKAYCDFADAASAKARKWLGLTK